MTYFVSSLSLYKIPHMLRRNSLHLCHYVCHHSSINTYMILIAVHIASICLILLICDAGYIKLNTYLVLILLIQ